jgi:hypothetical protein
MADGNFSTLEVVNPEYTPLRSDKAQHIDSGKQVVAPDGGKQVIQQPYSDGIDASTDHQHPTAGQNFGGLEVYEKKPRRNRKWLLIGGAVLLLVILGAVLGGVLGSRKSSKSSTASASASASSTPASSNATLSHKIAAVAFEKNKVNATRVYYQENDGTLMEAASSASNTTWGFTKIGTPEKKDSALAAAVSRPGFPLVGYSSVYLYSLT